MKFMLLTNTARDGYDRYMSWPKADLEAHFAFMAAFNSRLSETGELVMTHALGAPPEAKLVRAGQDGKPFTDGVFPESKEFLAGWWIIDVDSADRAHQIAADLSSAPGPDIEGADHFWIEVRRVMTSREDHMGE